VAAVRDAVASAALSELPTVTSVAER
jgi:hypothetical protein